MFEGAYRLDLCERALSLLQDPALEDKPVWLFDYERTPLVIEFGSEEWIQRSLAILTKKPVPPLPQPQPVRKIPDVVEHTVSLVDSVTGEWLRGCRCHWPAWFEELPCMKGHSLYVTAPFSEIRTQILTCLEQELIPRERENAGEDLRNLAQWKDMVVKRFKDYAPAAVRIEGDERGVTAYALRPERFKTMGVGSFLCDIKDGEISISPRAYEELRELRKSTHRCTTDLPEMEFFQHPTLMWVSAQPTVTVPYGNISIHARAVYGWLKRAHIKA